MARGCYMHTAKETYTTLSNRHLFYTMCDQNRKWYYLLTWLSVADTRGCHFCYWHTNNLEISLDDINPLPIVTTHISDRILLGKCLETAVLWQCHGFL